MLPDNPGVEHLQEHWDEIISVDKSAGWSVDFCKCVIPNNEEVVAGPNGRRYILRPCDHANKHHKSELAPSTSLSSLSSSSRKQSLVDDETPPTNTLVNSCGVMRTYENCTQFGTSGKGEKVKITVKSNAVKFSQPTISSLMDPKVSLFESPKNSAETWSQNYALYVITLGVNKNLSQAATFNLYETAMNGVRGYHNTVIGGIELNGRKIPPPP